MGSFNKLRLVVYFMEADLNLDKLLILYQFLAQAGVNIFLFAEEEILVFHLV